MGAATISQIMKQWLHRLFTGNYNILLILLFLLFVFRPYTQEPIYTGIWKSFLTLAVILAIFNCSPKLSTKVVISVLAIPVILLSWVNLIDQTSVSFILVALFTVIFMIICAALIIYDVLLRARVTLETLRGVVCAYFLVAFIFAYIYLLLEYLHPGTFQLNGQIPPLFPHERYFSQMLYFSFVTLLTVGFGDIVALQEWGQTAVVAEGIIGQFYVAILVARIVAVYSLYTGKHPHS